MKPGSKLRCVLERRHAARFKEMLSGKKLIFMLSQDAEHAARFDYFILYGGSTSPNLL